MSQKPTRIEPTFGSPAPDLPPQPQPKADLEQALAKLDEVLASKPSVFEEQVAEEVAVNTQVEAQNLGSANSNIAVSEANKTAENMADHAGEKASLEQEIHSHKVAGLSPLLSLSTKKSPSYTFTPPMTRPQDRGQANLATMEEQRAMQAQQVSLATEPAVETVAPTQTVSPEAVVETVVEAAKVDAQDPMIKTHYTLSDVPVTPQFNLPETAVPEATETPTAEPTATSNEVQQEAQAVLSASQTALGAAAVATAAAASVVNKPTPIMAEARYPKADSVPPTQADKSPAKPYIPNQEAESMPKVPSKIRRLLLVALIALALLLAFFLLKPNAPEPVEALQEQQGTSLPIEFRPVDEEEAKRAEAEAKALQEAQALAAQQAELQAAQQQSEQQQAQAQAATEQTAQGNISTPTTNEQASSTSEPVAAPEATPAKPVVQRPATVQVQKPQTQGSVIHQSETKVEPKAEPKAVEKKVVAKPAQPAKAQNQDQIGNLIKEVEAGRRPTAQAAPAKVAASSAKTLTVPKGVSLMQVFRDNNLNISDVNAMSKVNNAVSNLKAGDKVNVRLDSNNRVVEMRVGNGTYIRQANGTYTFK